MVLAGPGVPLVAELCLADLSAALGMTPDAGRAYLADALELAHRLPRLYARVMAGGLPVWRARRVASRTGGLSVVGADWVDRHLAHVAHRIGATTIERAVANALAQFDPAEARRQADIAADGRHATIDLRATDLAGTVERSTAVSTSLTASTSSTRSAPAPRPLRHPPCHGL